MMNETHRLRVVGGLAILALAVLTGVALWKTSRPASSPAEVLSVRPRGIMGTSCLLVAIARDRAHGEEALAEAEQALRDVEALMSAHLDSSEVSRLNRAPAEEEVALSPDTLQVLRAAKDAYRETEGAFDITCGPLLEYWRVWVGFSSIWEPQPLSEGALRHARSKSSWDLLELTESGARKRVETVQVDLGGLAKGHGIDKALAVLKEAGMLGGLVDVGGDLRCFGRPPEGEAWAVEVRNPFEEGVLLSLAIPQGGVCTSGNYARFIEVRGKRYSHIMDPRIGFPADAAPSVTVLAPTAREADIWATALSVLGEEGLDLLPHQVEAMVVVGSAEDHRAICTPGFGHVIAEAGRPELAIEKRHHPVSEATAAAGGG